MFAMYSAILSGINSCPMCIKGMFSKFPDKRNYIKLLNWHILELNICSRKSKYLEKWNFVQSSMYSVILRGINMSPMCIKKLFSNFPNAGNYIKLANLKFLFLKFCSISKYTWRNEILSYILCILWSWGVQKMSTMCMKNIFWNSPDIGHYIKLINLHFPNLKICSRMQNWYLEI